MEAPGQLPSLPSPKSGAASHSALDGSCHFFDHINSSSMSCCSVCVSSSDWISLNTFVSSAKRSTGDTATRDRSLTNNTSRVGPNTVHCGIPDVFFSILKLLVQLLLSVVYLVENS